MDTRQYSKDNECIRFFWKPQGNHQLSAANAAGLKELVSAFSKNESHLQTVSPLLLSVRRSSPKYGIETFDNLYADREKLQGEMDKLIAYRTKTRSAEPHQPKKKLCVRKNQGLPKG